MHLETLQQQTPAQALLTVLVATTLKQPLSSSSRKLACFSSRVHKAQICKLKAC